MQEVVGVQYKQASKVYYFSPCGKVYNVGDEVIVDTANGLSYAIIAQGNKAVQDSEIEPPLKNVLRLATQKDKEKLQELKLRAEKNLPTIVEKIEKQKLQMKVIDVQYAFDESKVTITYTSDDRVDFRELLKVLASALKTKIELRQVGVRDEVKLVGALGLCGRPCCCTTFLKEAEHVVVKMAKNQNLSLSPTKTGGACGKMMCCLAYEEPVYKEMLSKMPKVGTKIKISDGEGVIQYNDVMKQKVTVKVFENADSYKYIDYLVSDLNLNSDVNSLEEESKEVKQEETLKTSENLVAQSSNINYNNVSVDVEQGDNIDFTVNVQQKNNSHKNSDFKRKKFKNRYNNKFKGDKK